MNLTLPLPFLCKLLVATLAGFAVGMLYFAALRRTVLRFTASDGRWERVALTIGRMGVALALFAAAARMGAAALLVTFAGFLLARSAAIHRSRRGA